MTPSFRFPTIPHLASSHGTPDDTYMGLAESLAILPRITTVQPKRDGLNLGVRLRRGAVQIVLKDRQPDGHEWEALGRFRADILPRLTTMHQSGNSGMRVFGELDVAAPVVTSWFVFDVYSEKKKQFLNHDVVSSLAVDIGVPAMPCLRLGPVTRLEELDDLLTEDPRLEGLVLRCEDRNRVERFKYVRPGFKKSVWKL